MVYNVFTDGGSLNNQNAEERQGYYSYAIYNEDCSTRYRWKTKAKLYTTKEEQTNNSAEYAAIAAAITEVIDFVFKQSKNIEPEQRELVVVNMFTDSLLAVKQLSGEYKIKAPHLRRICNAIQSKISGNSEHCKVIFTWVPREQIVEKLGH